MNRVTPPARRTAAKMSRHFTITAFTLMEIIIAMSLVAVLMVLAWSLFQVYTRLEEKGSYLALEQQLARSLVRQVQTDLSRLVTPGLDLTTRMPASSDSVLPGQVWLVGTADTLEFLIRLPSDRWKQGSDLQSAPAMYQVISYRFTPRNDTFLGRSLATRVSDETRPKDASNPTNSDENQGKDNWVPPTGWLRESHWLIAPDDTEPGAAKLQGMAERDVIPPSRDVAPSNQLDIGPDRASEDSMGMENHDERIRDERDEVGEVTRYRIRYFGKEGWVEQWDSRSSGLLPAAIEFVFELDTKPPQADKDNLATEGDPETNDTEEGLRQLPTNTGKGESSDANDGFHQEDEFDDQAGDDVSNPVSLLGAEDDLSRPTRYRTVVPLTAHVPDDAGSEDAEKELP